MLNIIFICLIGIILGLISGSTGIVFSGFALVLFKYLSVGDYKTILGTVIYIFLFPLTIGSIWEFYKAKKINFFVGNLTLISLIIGSYFGSKLVLNDNYSLTEKKIKYISAILSFICGGLFLLQAYNL
jgi:uncharacterized membrane protein YfcA